MQDERGVFSAYFVVGLLVELGYPRETGLFRKRLVVPADAVDGAIRQMVLACALIGAYQPWDGLRLLASCFERDRDWSDPELGALFGDLDEGNRSTEMSDVVALMAVGPYRRFIGAALAEDTKEIPWEELRDERLDSVLQVACLQALYWGITSPEAVRSWLGAPMFAPGVPQAGFHLRDDSLETRRAMPDAAADILARFERERGRLSAPPSELMKLPQFARVEPPNA